MKAVTEAIATLTAERDRIDMAIKALGHLNTFADANLRPARKRRAKRAKQTRVLSASARASISAAQKRRWALYHKEHKRG